MIWDGASTKSHSVSAAEKRVNSACVRLMCRMCPNSWKSVSISPCGPWVSRLGRLALGGVKFATMAFTGLT